MAVNPPTVAQVFDIANHFGLHLSNEDASFFIEMMQGVFASCERLDELTEPKLPVKYPRSTGYRPSPAKNPLNAWYWRTEIKGAARGALTGKTVVLKDNVCLAGVPMMNGSGVLEGFVPDIDATIVTRILDAGGTIVGKSACENLSFAGGSHTNHLGAIRNPHKPTHSTNGSSGGSAALVAAGEVDMATGGDQGGSIRGPASWCGVYGLKPTYGLVPCTGIFPMELTIDYCGPICSSTADVALLLSVLAGRDGHDPRQSECEVGNYRGAIGKGVKGMKIALLKEGFGRPESEAATDSKVRKAIAQFKKLGATTSEVSVPMHNDGVHIWTAIFAEGACELMVNGNAQGTNWQGYYNTSMADAYARAWRSRPDALPPTLKFVLLYGEYMHRFYYNHYYAKAQNLRPQLRQAYDDVLATYDLIAMPTSPFKAQPIPTRGCPRKEYHAKAMGMHLNTCQFNASGHPAISIPCGKVNGLPIGMMLVGRRFDEVSVLRAADAFERSCNWKTM